MSEEIKDAGRVVPRAMIATILINAALGFPMILALLFCMGDIDAVMQAPASLAGYPFITIYYDAVKSLRGTNAMTSVSLLIVIFANWGLMAGCSRTTWAFARDRGLPASSFLAHVSPKHHIPIRSIVLCVVIQLLLGLINIGSTAAFNAFVNSAAVTLYISYVRLASAGLGPPSSHMLIHCRLRQSFSVSGSACAVKPYDTVPFNSVGGEASPTL